MRLAYGEGLRVPKTMWAHWDREKYFYQKSSYCRGYIFHHRSNATQQWFYHFLFGGFRGFFVQRVVFDYGLRVWFRIVWIPATFHFVGSILGQREYDANAYDYFYFSDWAASSFPIAKIVLCIYGLQMKLPWGKINQISFSTNHSYRPPCFQSTANSLEEIVEFIAAGRLILRHRENMKR